MVLNSEDVDVRRAEARRARDQERVKKLHDGRLRNIGADIVGVKNQIAEKQQLAQQQADEEEKQFQEQEDLRRYLIRVEAEETLVKRDEAAKLRRDWAMQSQTRSERREADIARSTKDFAAINVDGCNLSSAQKFDGEDRGRHERHRLQAAQNRDWAQLQMQERQARLQADYDDARAYADTMAHVSKLQDEAETEYEREKTKQALEVRKFNEAMLANQRLNNSRARARTLDMDQSEIQATVSSALVSENPLQAKTDVSGRVRVDHWKGLSPEQAKAVVFSNEAILAAKQAKREMERDAELEESRQQDLLRRQMAQYEYEAEKKRVQQTLEVQQTLKRQAEEAKERERRQKDLSQGKIEKGFFNSFGTSFR
ncbi:hypothetical protein SPRG_12008 [Saprolegnia parasitica CBS 223.65]|uniref:RIB43A-like with coiled-coils protein 2 n=1 Tax=Saprolegnia parasitica (strain CBS 223.65) TaxID=695850 RepID=A0A067C8K4_SAPPC|nr:hypothetical protein SPRG_12008 [Saprolegnia parasitica CBS 223.65]KDO22871.1 hypothetical protein SPRG_12008 [Saprolegnia parasitica CBS 223.65]|eukprot:XP_012206427.1 hypothetical protein SPRG_12008 [Saprolegnia parasitica CBS 223.65]